MKLLNIKENNTRGSGLLQWKTLYTCGPEIKKLKLTKRNKPKGAKWA